MTNPIGQDSVTEARIENDGARNLIEAAVQASIDAGLAVNGEIGVASARHAARFVVEAMSQHLPRLQPADQNGNTVEDDAGHEQ